MPPGVRVLSHPYGMIRVVAPPWQELEDELAVRGLEVTVIGTDQGASIEWHQSTSGDLAAHATLLLRENGVEWQRFWVNEEYRRRGIFKQAVRLQHGWFKTHGLGRSMIRRNAANADFYRDVAFNDEPDHGAFMVQDGRRSRSWLKGRD